MMLSKKYMWPNVKILLPGILFLLTDNSSAQAQEGPVGGQYYHIQQEVSRKDGVWMSRPRRDDERIMDLLYTRQIRSLEDYAQWVGENISYQRDARGDHWASPEETLNKKSGDCEDYTLLHSAVLRVLGYQPQFIGMRRRNGEPHAICLFRQNGSYVWFDNGHLVKTQAKSFADIAPRVAAQYRASALFEIDPSTKNWKVVYQAS